MNANRVSYLLRPILRFNRILRDRLSTSVEISKQTSIDKLRNVGVIAHIDAGKTTTTERILFYSGFTKVMGEVHDGDTIMDYMTQERERGITINSAAVTFKWGAYKINLIDTPGHVDFTVEVERSLRVLDGVVTIIDSSAGVEAQTITVWNQAEKYNVPRIIFCNKMDKARSSFVKSLESIEIKLKANVMPMQLPIGDGKSFIGVVDIINMNKVIWEDSVKSRGLVMKTQKLSELNDGKLWADANCARENLIGKLSDLDETLADKIILSESIKDISLEDLTSSIRRITLSQTGIPVFCGSAYKNIGVQYLMKGITHYLPSPADKRHDFVAAYGDNLCALAFKSVFHKQKGPITFLRLYSGKLDQGQKVYNVSRNDSEKIGRLYEVYADDFHEIPHSFSGNIVAVSGLRNVYTGDTIASSHSIAEAARQKYATLNLELTDNVPSVLTVVDIPEPVFFCTIEPASISQQKPLENALQWLQKEDPSFHVNFQDESDQIIISGMGELHIDVIKERIKSEYKVDCDLGPLNVAYKETMLSEHLNTHKLDRTIGETKHHSKITLSITPNPDGGAHKKLKFCHSKENDLQHIRRDRLQAIENGIKMGLLSGPLIARPVVDLTVGLHSFETSYSTSLTMISACASQCIREMLKSGTAVLLEPIMKLEIRSDENSLGAILADLGTRRSRILEIQTQNDIRIVSVLVPLAEIVGYSTRLRIITSGLGSFSLHFEKYEMMSNAAQNNIRK